MKRQDFISPRLCMICNKRQIHADGLCEEDYNSYKEHCESMIRANRDIQPDTLQDYVYTRKNLLAMFKDLMEAFKKIKSE